jgi:hypothetical protein
MDMFVHSTLTSEDITELRRILGDEIERTCMMVETLERQLKVEALIREGLKKMRREIQEREWTIDNAIAAVDRARSRHPSEMPRMPWIME